MKHQHTSLQLELCQVSPGWCRKTPRRIMEEMFRFHRNRCELRLDFESEMGVIFVCISNAKRILRLLAITALPCDLMGFWSEVTPREGAISGKHKQQGIFRFWPIRLLCPLLDLHSFREKLLSSDKFRNLLPPVKNCTTVLRSNAQAYLNVPFYKTERYKNSTIPAMTSLFNANVGTSKFFKIMFYPLLICAICIVLFLTLLMDFLLLVCFYYF